MDFFDQVDAYPDLREDLHEDAHAGQTTASKKSSASAEAPGQRLLKWLTWGVIAVLLVYGLVLTTAHVLARVVGIPRAQIILAHLYTAKYWWHPTDKAYAKELFREAVMAGSADAQYLLAYEYETEKNYAQAFPLYQDLALRGFVESQKRLGVLYVEGHGVSQNTAEGIKWLKTAAAQGDPNAHLALGFIYLTDRPNSPRNDVLAAQWMQSSAYLSDPKAQDMLAVLYAKGEGVPKNLDMAMYWADKSLDEGYPYSNYMDARKLYTLEAFMGREFVQYRVISDPGSYASALLGEAYSLLSQFLYGQLMDQGVYKPLYDSIGLSWNSASQSLDLDVSAVVTLLKARYDTNPAVGQIVIAGFADKLRNQGEAGALITAKLQQQGHIQGQGIDLYLATMGANLVRGTEGVDTLIAKAGINNFFVAGKGADILIGGDGIDTFQWAQGDGNDSINEMDGTSIAVDTLQLLDANASEVRLSRYADNLYITIGAEQITVANNFSGASRVLEQIQFSDGSSWQKAVLDAAPLLYLGTTGNDTLDGT